MFERSFRRTLLLWLLVPLVVILVTRGWYTYYHSVDIANTAYDRALFDTVLTIAAQVKNDKGHIVVDLPSAARRMLEVDQYDRVYYNVQDANGRLIIGWPDLPRPPQQKLTPEQEFYYTGEHDGQPLRLATAYMAVEGKPELGFVRITVAETTRKREIIAAELVGQTIAVQIVYVLTTLLAVWIAVRHALRPLKALSEGVASREASNLQPIALSDVPVELHPLISAFNGLMQKLDKSFVAQRKFIAYSAHQLRTPVAGMRAIIEAEMLGKSEQEIPTFLQRLHGSVLRLSHLVKQLLTLSRAVPGMSTQKQLVDLGAAALEVVDELQAAAADKHLRVDTSIAAGVIVDGDPVMIPEMLMNLLDNAIRYSPDGGRIWVTVWRERNSAILRIADEGSGLAEEEREKVFQHFYRGEAASPGGVGLGLAIVREIAEAHDATVNLAATNAKGGLTVTIEFRVFETVGT